MAHNAWTRLRRLMETPSLPQPAKVDQILEDAYHRILVRIAEDIRLPRRGQVSKDIIIPFCKDHGIEVTDGNARTLLKRVLPDIVEAGLATDFFALLAAEPARPSSPEDEDVPRQVSVFLHSGQKDVKLARIRQTCSDFGLKPRGRSKQDVLESVFPTLIEQGRLEEFTKALAGDKGRKKTIPPRDLQAIYNDVCGHSFDVTLEKLSEHFPENQPSETELKSFLQQFGITVRRPKKHSTWLKKVAKELSSSHGGAKLLH